MANLNKVMLIGHLTRDPEVRAFANGGKVAKFGFAVNNRRRNAQSGQWENEPVFLDVEAFNRGETGKQADLVETNLRKGSHVFIEGHLQLDQWTSQDGQKRSKIKVVLDNLQFLDRRQDGPGGENRGGHGGPMNTGRPGAGGGYHEDFEGGHDAPPPPRPAAGGMDEDIPF